MIHYAARVLQFFLLCLLGFLIIKESKTKAQKGIHDSILNTWAVGKYTYSIEVEENNHDSCYDIYAIKEYDNKRGFGISDTLATYKLHYWLILSLLEADYIKNIKRKDD